MIVFLAEVFSLQFPTYWRLLPNLTLQNILYISATSFSRLRKKTFVGCSSSTLFILPRSSGSVTYIKRRVVLNWRLGFLDTPLNNSLLQFTVHSVIALSISLSAVSYTCTWSWSSCTGFRRLMFPVLIPKLPSFHGRSDNWLTRHSLTSSRTVFSCHW
jgi:hypothetical protein